MRCELNLIDIALGSVFDLGYAYEKIDEPFCILSKLPSVFTEITN